MTRLASAGDQYSATWPHAKAQRIAKGIPRVFRDIGLRRRLIISNPLRRSEARRKGLSRIRVSLRLCASGFRPMVVVSFLYSLTKHLYSPTNPRDACECGANGVSALSRTLTHCGSHNRDLLKFWNSIIDSLQINQFNSHRKQQRQSHYDKRRERPQMKSFNNIPKDYCNQYMPNIDIRRIEFTPLRHFFTGLSTQIHPKTTYENADGRYNCKNIKAAVFIIRRELPKTKILDICQRQKEDSGNCKFPD